MTYHHRSKVRQAALKHGYRSGLEDAIRKQLEAAGVDFKYEKVRIKYTPPTAERRYTPDFLLPNGILVETKGRFVTADRQKIKMVKQQYRLLDLRLVFSNAKARISKTSKTTYAMWAEANHIPWAEKRIPKEWLQEPKNYVSLDLAQMFSLPEDTP